MLYTKRRAAVSLEPCSLRRLFSESTSKKATDFLYMPHHKVGLVSPRSRLTAHGCSCTQMAMPYTATSTWTASVSYLTDVKRSSALSP